MIITGNRIVIKLDDHPTHTVLASGIEVAQFTLLESDGGRMITKASNTKHLSKGTVTHISPYAALQMEKEGTPLKVGDRVYVNPQTVSTQYQFFLERDAILLDFDGLIAVPHTLIEAIIN